VSQPTTRDVHIDRVLTNISIAYWNEPQNWIADQIFPRVPVARQSDVYLKYNRNDWFRDEAQERAPATESEGGGYNLDGTGTYFARNYAYHKDIPDEVRANADAPIQPDREATRFVMQKLALRKERKFAADFFKAGVWTDSNLSVPWSTYATSSPIEDIEERREAMHAATGFEPNLLVMGRSVWSKLKNHPDFLERIQYTQRAQTTLEIAREFLEIPKILIGSNLYATNVEGDTAAYDRIWGKHALLLYVTDAPALLTPTAGYNFVWNPFGGGGDPYMRRLRNDFALFDRIEGHVFFDYEQVAADMGIFMTSVVA